MLQIVGQDGQPVALGGGKLKGMMRVRRGAHSLMPGGSPCEAGFCPGTGHLTVRREHGRKSAFWSLVA